MSDSQGILEWVKSNSLATQKFKEELKRTIEDAYEKDPEIGLDFDPIFDAQDYPEEGFTLDSLDVKTGYLIVRGKKWKEFKLVMKLVYEDKKWLVDGCGIINIVKGKRMQR